MNNSESQRLKELDSAPIGGLLWKYSLPAIVGMMVMSLYNVIGRVFIGQGVGPDAIAGLAITFPVMNVSTAFGVLIGAGASARTSLVLGMGQKRKAEMILGNSLVMTLIFGTIYIALFAIFLNPVLRLFGASDTSLPYARDYMMWILPGLLFTNMTYTFNNVMRATGYPTRAMVTMFIGAGLNVVLAPIFIFWLKWGIKGAAIASDIAMFVSMFFVMRHFFDKRSEVHLTPGTYRLQWDVLRPILAIGASPCIINTAGCVINALINHTLFRYGGDSSVAAMGIFNTFTSLLVTFVLGIAMGMQPVVGYNYGARRWSRVRRAFVISVSVGVATCSLGSVICQIMPQYVAMMFTTDDNLIKASVHALRITTIMFWGAAFQILSSNFFQSIGSASKSVIMSLSRQVLFFIPGLIMLPSMFGLTGVWMTFPISDALSMVLAIVMLWREFRSIARLEAAQ